VAGAPDFERVERGSQLHRGSAHFLLVINETAWPVIGDGVVSLCTRRACCQRGRAVGIVRTNHPTLWWITRLRKKLAVRRRKLPPRGVCSPSPAAESAPVANLCDIGLVKVMTDKPAIQTHKRLGIVANPHELFFWDERVLVGAKLAELEILAAATRACLFKLVLWHIRGGRLPPTKRERLLCEAISSETWRPGAWSATQSQ
jgi:hypothetical protein